MASVIAIACVLVALLAQPAAVAEEVFPSRPITIVVAFPPGGIVDVHARAFGPVLERLLGQPVVVVNKSGAAGTVGTQAAVTSKPDGYTLLMTTNSTTIALEVARLRGRKYVFGLDDLAPVAVLSAAPPVLVVRSDSAWSSVKELAAEARRRPGALSFGSAGMHSTMHLAMHLFARAAKIDLRHVPFPGSPPAATAVLGGHVDMSAQPPSVVLSQVKAGELRALATWGEKRSDDYAGVPTLTEAGFDAEFLLWTGVFYPRGVPAARALRVQEAFRQAAEAPEVKEALARVGVDINYVGGEHFGTMLAKEFKAMGPALAEMAVNR